MPKFTTILVVDDHAIVRRGTIALLQEFKQFKIVGEAASGREAIEMARNLKPDLILMDLMMPGMNGVEATQTIVSENPKAKILALTSISAEEQIIPVVKAGALGYFTKDGDPDDLLKAITQTAAGKPYISVLATSGQDQTTHLIQTDPDIRRYYKMIEQLTKREREVLKLIAAGLNNQEVANELSVTTATARTHASNVIKKLNVANRVQATLIALRFGVVSLDELPQVSLDAD